MGDKYASLRRAQLHLDFIHANSTTHSFIFGALAELLDNARDAGAARLDVFSVDNEKLQGGFMLCFLDDGCGMSPEEASDIIYFGTSKKRSSTLKFIGQYGNGLKSGSMRIGKDFILFTKKEETMTCVFFSQTFCEREGLTEVVVPIPSWLTRTRKSVTDDPQKFSTELSIIFKYSPFRNEAELMQQFDVIYGKCGTLLVVYNLKLLLSGEPELDVKTDKEDILMAGALEDFPERWSFRAYTSVLYFEPWMRIFIQAKRVKTKHLCYCLYRPRKYLYVTSSFKGAFKNEVKKAEEAVKIAELVLKEAQVTVNRPDKTSLSSAKDVLQKALEDVEAKHKILKEKQRELKKARTLCLIFGVNIESRSQAGMFIYSNNRLIKMHEKVGPQLKLKSLLGAGVVGIVNIPLEIMEPSHNKQEFLNVQEYNHLLRVMGQYLVQYCKDTGISNRNLTLFWNEFGYQNDKDMEKSLDSVQYQRRQAMAIPFIIQCDLCLKWRILPSSITYQEKEFFDLWICANNPNPLENSCHQAERLPSIPLGTMSSVSPSKTEKEKQLREAIQRYHSRLADSQPQVLDKSDTEVSLKQEKKEVSLMKKEKQEPCSDTPEIKRNSSLPNRESAPMEDLSPSPGHNTSFTVSGCCHIAALLKESSQSTSVKETVRKLASNLREILQYFFPQYQLPSEFGYTSVEELAASFELEQCPEQTNKKLRMCFNQIQNVYMAQYERELKRKMQSIIYDANRRGAVNEISLGQCEEKRKITEDKLNNLRVKLAALLQKLQLGSPAGDQEQIDRYLEALLKEDNPLLRNALNKVTTDVGHGLPLEKNGK
ncbi:MORC family CW-type zinc finger protein 1 isoform X3 [Leptonychotes weddellii]|uniref:MORC family CW-type zinc finger protein 1 n=1 Tax=Leptonychotes weddellii TaxID=9713 RepID=A0A7F8QFP0_LEPWE|nr:MORC family CW-type zinc finger protein 1 isoform X3 [Leptonychotes weddellii]